MPTAKEEIEALRTQVAATTDVDASAKNLIDGFAARQQAAIDAAIGKRQTAQINDLTQQVDALTGDAEDVAAETALQAAVNNAGDAAGQSSGGQLPAGQRPPGVRQGPPPASSALRPPGAPPSPQIARP